MARYASPAARTHSMRAPFPHRRTNASDIAVCDVKEPAFMPRLELAAVLLIVHS